MGTGIGIAETGTVMSHVRGTYASCRLEPSCAARLHSHFEGLLPGLKAPEKFHFTTTFTEVTLPQLVTRSVGIVIDRRTFSYDLFGEDRSLLVLKVASPELESLHRHAIELGATWDFPDFKPHLTLTGCFEVDGNALPPLPDFDLIVDRYVVGPLPGR